MTRRMTAIFYSTNTWHPGHRCKVGEASVIQLEEEVEKHCRRQVLFGENFLQMRVSHIENM
jgi:hypothetical protein